MYRYNDTIRRIQKFYDYYAYDDGVAESGAGIYGVGTSHAYLAYKFTVLKGDTLRAMKVFFNRTKTEANRKYFILTVWDDNNGTPGNIVYQQIGYRPEFLDSLNAFVTYKLDTAIFVDSAETFYIGWERTTEDFLNIGFDKNHDASDKIFFNINGYWEQSPLYGALMIRPVFSKEPYVKTSEPKYNGFEVEVFPNPAGSFINVRTSVNGTLKILNSQGLTVYESKIQKRNTVIDLSAYSPGLYFIIIDDGRGNKQIRKFIKH